MQTRFLTVGVAVCSAFVVTLSNTRGHHAVETIAISRLEDKIRGGWAGQMIGVSFGAPTEFRYLGQIIPEDSLPRWQPDMVRDALDQDDLYVDMTLAAVLAEKGLDATTDDFGAMFRNAKYHLWHANLAARRALKRGVPATLSGTPSYNAHANDIDFQIESDFVGLMSPGLPQSASNICIRAGRVMNSGDGILGGVFVSSMYAAAFFEHDMRRIVEAGLASLPAGSPYARVIHDVLEWSRQFPNDWAHVWQLVNAKWDRREPCPEGALRPFNIDAKLNGAYVALGLLYGDGDFQKTITIATRAGQDSDCNPASAAGVLGVVLGFEGIPDEYKRGIAQIADEKFSYTSYTFNTIVASTLRRAIAAAQLKGGRVEGDSLRIPIESPSAAAVPTWDDYGSPVERVSVDDSRWTFDGDWHTLPRGGRPMERRADSTGAEASISFEGTGVIVGGTYLRSGGTADIYLDGALHRTVDVYSDEEADKTGEDVWHAFGLLPGTHRVRIVVRGERYRGANGDASRGSAVSLSYLLVFRR